VRRCVRRRRSSSRSEPLDEFVDEVTAFAHGLATERSKPLGDPAEAIAKRLAIGGIEEGGVLGERFEVFAHDGASFGGGEDDFSVEFGVLAEQSADHTQFEAVDGAGEFEAGGEVDILAAEKIAKSEGGEVAQGLDEGHRIVVDPGVHGDDDIAPGGELVEQPLAGFGIAAGASGHDLFIHGGGAGAEEGVQSDGWAGVGGQHGLQWCGFDAGKIGEEAGGREVWGERVDDGDRSIAGHRVDGGIVAGAEVGDVGPIRLIQAVYLVTGAFEPVGEVAAHFPGAADDEDASAGADWDAADLGGLADAGLAEDGAEEFFDVIGVQTGAGGLVAALGDEVFFAGGVVDGQVLGGFEGDDLVDGGVALGEQGDDLFVDGIDLPSQRLECGGCIRR